MRLDLQLIFGALLLAASSLAGAQGFYTKNAFLNAAIQYSGFGDDATADDSAAFIAHATHKTGDEVSVEDVVTQEFFDDITDQASDNCEGKGFYTRDAFLEAAFQYSDFSNATTADDYKREMAAFFAHVAHETEYLCYIEEREKSISYCDASVIEYPCVAGKKYYGRGPLQLSWNYNYGAAGQAIGFDGLYFPEIVSSDAVISFKTALWYWMKKVHGVVGEGFGATIRAIAFLECNGGNVRAVNHRVRLYIDYCNKFGVSPGDNLYC